VSATAPRPVRTPAPAPLRGLSGHDPARYVRHSLHGDGRSYLETNCYTDILIELLHACGREPLAMLGHLVRMDFEGDQWTFFKAPPEDLERLFGVDIHEMQPYRPLPVQIAEQLERGRTMIVELDAFYLPDTSATSYRREHVKTSVAAEAIDPERRAFRYFHGSGLFECEAEDYAGLFRIDRQTGGEVLPPYTELVRFDAGTALNGSELRGAARALLAGHLARRPPLNPFAAFAAHLGEVLPSLLASSLEEYHAYAFATVRMAGSAFELAGAHTDWLLGPAGEPAVSAMAEIVDGAKALSFRLARRKPFDPGTLLDPMARAWERALTELDEVVR
jgi:uncharacterized protein DUF1839